MSYSQVSISPLIYSWANIICADDAEERAFIMGALNAVGNAMGAWIPLLAWKTVEAPRYFKGYVMSIVIAPLYFGVTLLVFYLAERQKKQKAAEKERTEEGSFESAVDV